MSYTYFEREMEKVFHDMREALYNIGKTQSDICRNREDILILAEAVAELTQEVKSISSLLQRSEMEQRRNHIDEAMSDEDSKLYIKIEDIRD